MHLEAGISLVVFDLLTSTAHVVVLEDALSTEPTDQLVIQGEAETPVAANNGHVELLDDLADATSKVPLLRESTRLQAAVLVSTQATYDLTKWESFLGPSNPDWWTSPNEAAEFYHFTEAADLQKPEAQSILKECDMLTWISKEDAPVFVSNFGPDGPSQNRNHYLHHPEHARQIEAACEAAGVECLLAGAGKPDAVTFLLGVLKGGEAE
jgi:hypothetical protein